MKALILISFLMLSITAKASGPIIQPGTYRGTGGEGWSGERKACEVTIKKVYSNHDILVKSSYDSLFFKGYRLAQFSEDTFQFIVGEGVRTTTVEVKFDQRGALTLYNKSVYKESLLMPTTVSSWCEIKK